MPMTRQYLQPPRKSFLQCFTKRRENRVLLSSITATPLFSWNHHGASSNPNKKSSFHHSSVLWFHPDYHHQRNWYTSSPSCSFSFSSSCQQYGWFSTLTNTDDDDDDDDSLTSMSSSFPFDTIRILYASQTGTAQLFAQELADALSEELSNHTLSTIVKIQAWNDCSSPNQLIPLGHDNNNNGITAKTLHVFITSVTGVGDPPDNGRAFYNYLSELQPDSQTQGQHWKSVHYAMFGLGNSKAHPNHYNVIAKYVDEKLQQLGAKPILELGLGDDGDCIEDDFDQWMETLIRTVIHMSKQEQPQSQQQVVQEDVPGPADETEVRQDSNVSFRTDSQVDDDNDHDYYISCPPGVAKSSNGKRRISKKYPPLQLLPPLHSTTGTDPSSSNKQVMNHLCNDLFHLQGTSEQFYKDGTALLDVLEHKLLTASAGESGLHEIAISLQKNHPASGNGKSDDDSSKYLTYETGDHLTIYPCNSECLVKAYLNILDVDPFCVISPQNENNNNNNNPYPYPKGISLYETLMHCVDLGAVPSPSFARLILGRKDIDYKQDIALPRRTPIDMLLEQPPDQRPKLSLEDFLYNLTPMKVRYYTISSSSRRSPKLVRLTFRPVKYMTSRGILREGLCTSYLSHKGVVREKNVDGSDNRGGRAHVAAFVNSNPKFRLPTDPKTPILMIAGGCGVAAIRAFVEERIAMAQECHVADASSMFGPAQVYLGFRNEQDEVYSDLMQQGLQLGALTNGQVAYSGDFTTMSSVACDHGLCRRRPNATVTSSTTSTKRMNVDQLVLQNGSDVWQLLEKGGHVYVCGGARTLGAAVEQVLLEIIQMHGNRDWEGAEQYLRDLLKDGRLLEDLAD